MSLTPRPFLFICATLLCGLLSACAKPTPEQKASGVVFDPYEETNRSLHEFNLGVDKALFRPASKGYVSIVPEPLVTSFSYFTENLSMPGQMVNALLQGDLRTAGSAVSRFLINTTVGFAGLADPASDFEIPEVDTDFGETLHVWGAGEGFYLEIPLYGPSTSRDAVGLVVDLFTNPMGYATHNPVDNITVYAEIVRRMGDRGNYSDTIDAILYESADSYSQLRLLYMQNRRFELGQTDEANEIDPFELDTEGF
ncbi:VacJ family lipoprotein [Aliisedimentitalea scapharcae]|uniref:VacJ family lipoprotein n=1 Tax=Aliisedimentitalea scapharcae TaxID=1524259 RepID=A0ABZ2XQW5_9RHOB|nr:VacJ family lipoprotein [Rhodobacteraceae bacterium M382]